MLIVVGIVVQNVVAKRCRPRWSARLNEAGNQRPEEDVRTDLGMVQVLGRLALSAGMLAVAGLSGWLASILALENSIPLGVDGSGNFFLCDGVLLISFETTERRPLDWRILGGGIALGVVILILALGSVPFSQELIFVLSMVVVCAMLVVVTRDLDADTRRSILYASVVIFVFRASPTVGDGYFWWTLDVLKFDGAFYGTLRQTAAILSIVAIWLLSKQVTEYPVAKVLFWIVIASTILSLPNISLFYGLHHWTEARFGLAHARSPSLTRQPPRRSRNSALFPCYADCLLCTCWTPRDLVCPDGVTYEFGAGGRAAADEVPQSDLHRWPWRLCRTRPAADCGRSDRARRTARNNPLAWTAD